MLKSLIAVALLALPLLLSACGAEPPATLPAKSPVSIYQNENPIVIVHGAWAGGWEWKEVGALLQQRGHHVYRPTLTGQGDRMHLASASVDLNTHIQDIVNVINFEDLHDVTLVGHSYGGMVIAGVADRIPERIKCLIFIDAFVPEDGESVNTLTGTTRPSTNGFIAPPGPPRPADAKPPFIVPMSAKIFATAEVLKNPAAKKIPASFILCVDPNQPIEQARFFKYFQRAHDRGYATFTVASDHVVNRSHPRQLVPLIERAATDAKVNP